MKFRWNLQLLTRYARFKNLPWSTIDLWTTEDDTISVALNISGFTRTIVLDVLNFGYMMDNFIYDRMDNFIGLLLKIMFYCIYGKMFYLIKSFTVINSEICHLDASLFFYLNCIPNDVLHILLSSCHVINHLICRNKLSQWALIWS